MGQGPRLSLVSPRPKAGARRYLQCKASRTPQPAPPGHLERRQPLLERESRQQGGERVRRRRRRRGGGRSDGRQRGGRRRRRRRRRRWSLRRRMVQSRAGVGVDSDSKPPPGHQVWWNGDGDAEVADKGLEHPAYRHTIRDHHVVLDCRVGGRRRGARSGCPAGVAGGQRVSVLEGARRTRPRRGRLCRVADLALLVEPSVLERARSAGPGRERPRSLARLA